MRNTNFLPKETVLRIIDSPRTKEQMVDIIKCISEVEAVEIKEGMTNGDVIKAMFPNNSTSFLVVNMGRNDWWNAPYRVKSEGGKK